MERIIHVRALSDFRLEVEFDDGTEGVVDVSSRLFGPMFDELQDPLFFAQVGIDEFGAICWPNGADLAPDGLSETIRGASSTRARQ